MRRMSAGYPSRLRSDAAEFGFWGASAVIDEAIGRAGW